MTLSLISPAIFAFLLMIVSFADQYILKVIPFLYKKIYSSCRSGQIHGIWHLILINVNVNKCNRKSFVVKYLYNMCQANALSDNNFPLLALLAKKHLGFAVSTTDFIHI